MELVKNIPNNVFYIYISYCFRILWFLFNISCSFLTHWKVGQYTNVLSILIFFFLMFFMPCNIKYDNIYKTPRESPVKLLAARGNCPALDVLPHHPEAEGGAISYTLNTYLCSSNPIGKLWINALKFFKRKNSFSSLQR